MEEKKPHRIDVKGWDPDQSWEEIPVRTRMNNYFGKTDVVFGSLDLLEKICRQSEIFGTIALAEIDLAAIKKETPNDTDRIKKFESAIEWLKNHYAWAEEMWHQGAFALQYNQHITLENIRLKRENMDLKKENLMLKKQIDF